MNSHAWGTKRQDLVALSTIEVENVASVA